MKIVRIALPIVMFCGCDGEAGSGGAPADPGLRIVESEVTSRSGGEVWRISDEPVLVIGSEDVPELRFTRIIQTARLHDGSILVANGFAPPQIRIFDAAGTLLTAIGGAGEGPGEFSLLQGVWVLGTDTIVAYDPRQLRATWFDRGGRLLRTEALPRLLAGGFVAIDRFDDGGWLLVENAPVRNEQADAPVNTRLVARAEPDASRSDTLGTIRESTLVREGLEFEIPLFMPSFAVYAANGDRLYTGYPDAFEIDVRASDGTHLHRIRHRAERRRLTDDLYQALIEERVAARPEASRAAFRQEIRRRPRPDALPAFGTTFVVDAGNNLWVQPFIAPGDQRAEWKVFDERGGLVGSVDLPAAFQPMHVGDDELLGVWRDALNVETLRSYRLQK